VKNLALIVRFLLVKRVTRGKCTPGSKSYSIPGQTLHPPDCIQLLFKGCPCNVGDLPYFVPINARHVTAVLFELSKQWQLKETKIFTALTTSPPG